MCVCVCVVVVVVVVVFLWGIYLFLCCFSSRVFRFLGVACIILFVYVYSVCAFVHCVGDYLNRALLYHSTVNLTYETQFMHLF